MKPPPGHLGDMPPPLAERAEQCRRLALDWLFAHDYRLFAPPLAEHLETLTAGDKTLDVDTFKMTDTLSGETLGLRADHTQQVLRYDRAAASGGIRRYCYCGPVIRAHPPQAWKLREDMQLGAEIFGANDNKDKNGNCGEMEIARVACGMLSYIGVVGVAISVAHAGIVRELLTAAESNRREEILRSFIRRDAAAIRKQNGGEVLAKLCALGGGEEAIEQARKLLPQALLPMLDEVAVLRKQLALFGGDAEVDFSDIGGYGYHTGAVFVFYGRGFIAARGGGFQQGAGFSANLREIAEHLPPMENAAAVAIPLNAEVSADKQWQQAVAKLEQEGRRLHFAHSDKKPSPPCLQKANGKWQVCEQ